MLGIFITIYSHSHIKKKIKVMLVYIPHISSTVVGPIQIDPFDFLVPCENNFHILQELPTFYAYHFSTSDKITITYAIPKHLKILSELGYMYMG